MSRSLSAPRGVSRAMVAGTIALALAVLAAIGFAPKANADFTTGKCAGPNITGRGGSFARDAHAVFNFNFKHNYCAGTPGFGTINVTYEPPGSGAGVNVDRSTGRWCRASAHRRPADPGTGRADEHRHRPTRAQTRTRTTTRKSTWFPRRSVRLWRWSTSLTAATSTTSPAASKTPEQNLDADATPDDVIRVLLHEGSVRGDLGAGGGRRFSGGALRDLAWRVPDPPEQRGLQHTDHPRGALRRVGHDLRVQGLPERAQPRPRMADDLRVRQRT